MIGEEEGVDCIVISSTDRRAKVAVGGELNGRDGALVVADQAGG